MFLSYCSENGISYEALEEEVGTYVPDVMGRWKRGTVVDSNTENAPLIPECIAWISQEIEGQESTW